MANWQDYLNKYEDAQIYIDDAQQAGIDTGTTFNTTYKDWLNSRGLQDTSGWEQNWINLTNQRLGTNYTDAGQFTDDQLAQTHYENWGKNEGRTWEGQGITEGQAGNAKDDYFDTQKFQTLLEKLEGSKGRQQRQKSLEGRRDTYAGGLAQMMGNF
jgi:hypothetical protein